MIENEFLSGGLVLMAIGSVLAMCRPIPSAIWTFLVRQFSMTVEIRNEDSLFDYFEKWIDRKMERKMKDVVARTDLSISPAPGFHIFKHGNKILRVQRERSEKSGSSSYRVPEKFRIQILPCRDPAVARELIREIKRESVPDDGNMVGITIGDDYFETRKRKLSSLFFKQSQKEDLVRDIKWFLDNREWYEERGIPWSRGYLLYGPPGNGKTSLVRAIASEFDIGIKTIDLGITDMELNVRLASSSDKICLIEDLDCHEFVKSRVERAPKPQESAKNVSFIPTVTLSGFLNALDGIIPSEGRILFMTTNCPDDLDSALMRPGRIDRKILVDNAVPEQAEAMFHRFFPSRNGDAEEFARMADGTKSMADIQHALLEKQAEGTS